METYTIKTKHRELKVEIPTTDMDWELYTSMSGSGRAARSLTAALKRSLRAVPKLVGEGMTVPEALGQAKRIPDGFDAAQGKYAEFGAADTEPNYYGNQALIDLGKLLVFGSTDDYHPELGDWL